MTTTTAAITVEQIAMICHEANKAYCEAIGDNSQLSWADAADWQRSSAIEGVKFRMNNPTAPQSAQHESWMKQKLDEGWVYGEKKDPEAKTHHCLVAYDQLPEEQRRKDALFQAVVDSLSGARESLVIISASEYHSLNIAESKLQALEGAGVDNWSGYEDAMASFRQQEADKEEA